MSSGLHEKVGERVSEEVGRTPYTIEELSLVANELNVVMQLNPLIDLHLEKNDMEDHLLEAVRLAKFSTDKFTPETYNVVRHLRRNFNKYVRFPQAKTQRVTTYLTRLLKQEKWTRNQIRLMAENHFKGTVSRNLIESVLSFGRKKHLNHKKHRFGNYYMEMDPLTKVERLVEA